MFLVTLRLQVTLGYSALEAGAVDAAVHRPDAVAVGPGRRPRPADRAPPADDRRAAPVGGRTAALLLDRARRPLRHRRAAGRDAVRVGDDRDRGAAHVGRPRRRRPPPGRSGLGGEQRRRPPGRRSSASPSSRPWPGSTPAAASPAASTPATRPRCGSRPPSAPSAAAVAWLFVRSSASVRSGHPSRPAATPATTPASRSRASGGALAFRPMRMRFDPPARPGRLPVHPPAAGAVLRDRRHGRGPPRLLSRLPGGDQGRVPPGARPALRPAPGGRRRVPGGRGGAPVPAAAALRRRRRRRRHGGVGRRRDLPDELPRRVRRGDERRRRHRPRRGGRAGPADTRPGLAPGTRCGISRSGPALAVAQ